MDKIFRVTLLMLCGLVTAMPAASQGHLQTYDEQPGAWDTYYYYCECESGYSANPGVIDQATCEAPDACLSTGFFLDRSGYVGIGTTTPNHPIDVVGEINAHYSYSLRTDDYIMSIMPTWNNNTSVYDLRILNFDTGTIAFSTDTSSHSATVRMRVFNNGDVGIGLPWASSPSYKLHVAGQVGATGFVNTSSRESKTAIEKVTASETDEMLGELLAMEPTTYEYKDEYSADGRRHLGFIAENLPAALQAGDGRGVDLYALMTYTVGALQAQQRQIEQLHELHITNKQLQKENSELRSEVSRLRQFELAAITSRTTN
jgi:hypothetical protein